MATSELVVTTYDWSPEFAHGLIRDIRLRWALEEMELPYRVETVPFRDRGPDHFARQPFGQVPWLTDGDVTIFESGAALLHLAQTRDVLMPDDAQGRADVLQWVFAALNSVETATGPWFGFVSSDFARDTPEWKRIDGTRRGRLDRMETVLADREWLTRAFSVADIAMADVLRVADRLDALADHPACRAYVARATTRPAFQKAYADQVAHFAA